MKIDFEKWHGCKNDFIIVWINEHDDFLQKSLQNNAPMLCSRSGSGVGADGIIVLIRKNSRELIPEKLIVINADGSLAKTCGNGIRCAALSVLKRCRAEQKSFDEIPEFIQFDVDSREIDCHYLGRFSLKDSQRMPLVSVNMGSIYIDEENRKFSEVKDEIIKRMSQIKSKQDLTNFHYCMIGNEHLVFFVDELEQNLINVVGPIMQDSDLWDGINVHVAARHELLKGFSEQLGEQVDEVFVAYSWERGVGLTQACGSGACAIAATAFKYSYASRMAWIAIKMPGGNLFVKQEDSSDSITLAGPGEFVYAGIIEI